MVMIDIGNVREQVKQVVIKCLGLKDEDVAQMNDNSHFFNDLKADSLDIVDMIMAFEEEFDIEISDDAAQKIETFGDAVKYIEQRKSSEN